MQSSTRQMLCTCGRRLRELQKKLNRPENLISQLVHLQSPATALVVLRFRLVWCQISYHARAVPPDSLRKKDASISHSHSVPRRYSPSSDIRRHLAPRSSIHQEGRPWHQRLRAPLSRGLPSLKQQHRGSLQHPLGSLQLHARPTPDCYPCAMSSHHQRRHSAAFWRTHPRPEIPVELVRRTHAGCSGDPGHTRRPHLTRTPPGPRSSGLVHGEPVSSIFDRP